jgi:hypothetical protein
MTWPRWVNLILGIWLLIAPPVLGYLGTDVNAWTNDRVLGVLVGIVAIIGLWYPRIRYVNVAFGVWLIIAPFVLAFVSSSAIANDIVIGIAVAVFAFIPSTPLARGTNRQPGSLA